MNTTTAARIDATLAPLRLRWLALPPRQQLLLALAGAAVSLLLIWTLAVQPALRTLQQAAVQNDRLEADLQAMQRLAEEARTLQATPPVPLEQAAAALQAATERLGPAARLSLQGDRAVLTLNEVGTSALFNWLAEARGGARARPVEASLSRAEQGYSGTLVLTLGGGA